MSNIEFLTYFGISLYAYATLSMSFEEVRDVCVSLSSFIRGLHSRSDDGNLIDLVQILGGVISDLKDDDLFSLLDYSIYPLLVVLSPPYCPLSSKEASIAVLINVSERLLSSSSFSFKSVQKNRILRFLSAFLSELDEWKEESGEKLSNIHVGTSLEEPRTLILSLIRKIMNVSCETSSKEEEENITNITKVLIYHSINIGKHDPSRLVKENSLDLLLTVTNDVMNATNLLSVLAGIVTFVVSIIRSDSIGVSVLNRSYRVLGSCVRRVFSSGIGDDRDGLNVCRAFTYVFPSGSWNNSKVSDELMMAQVELAKCMWCFASDRWRQSDEVLSRHVDEALELSTEILTVHAEGSRVSHVNELAMNAITQIRDGKMSECSGCSCAFLWDEFVVKRMTKCLREIPILAKKRSEDKLAALLDVLNVFLRVAKKKNNLLNLMYSFSEKLVESLLYLFRWDTSDSMGVISNETSEMNGISSMLLSEYESDTEAESVLRKLPPHSLLYVPHGGSSYQAAVGICRTVGSQREVSVSVLDQLRNILKEEWNVQNGTHVPGLKIICEVLRGCNWLDKSENSERLCMSFVDIFLDEKLWNTARSSVDGIDYPDPQLRTVDQFLRVTLRCLLVEGLATVSILSGHKFRGAMLTRSLFRILETLGDSHLIASTTSAAVLQAVACSCGFSSALHLISSKIPILVDNISRQIRLPTVYPHAPSMLKSVLLCAKQFSSQSQIREEKKLSVFALLSDIIDSLLEGMRISKNGVVFLSYLRVLSLSVQLLHKDAITHSEEINKNKEQEMKIDDTDTEGEEDVAMKMNDEKSLPENEIINRILSDCVHFMSHPSLKGKISLLDLIEEGSKALRNDTKLLYPTLHLLWPSLMTYIKNIQHDSVKLRCCELVFFLVGSHGGFLRQRFCKQMLPLLREILVSEWHVKRGVVSISSLHLTPGDGRRETSKPFNEELCVSIFTLLEGICRIDSSPVEDDVYSICFSCVPFLRRLEKRNMFSERICNSVESLLKSLSAVDGHSTWLALLELNLDLNYVLTPQCSFLNEISTRRIQKLSSVDEMYKANTTHLLQWMEMKRM